MMNAYSTINNTQLLYNTAYHEADIYVYTIREEN